MTFLELNTLALSVCPTPRLWSHLPRGVLTVQCNVEGELPAYPIGTILGRETPTRSDGDGISHTKPFQAHSRRERVYNATGRAIPPKTRAA